MERSNIEPRSSGRNAAILLTDATLVNHPVKSRRNFPQPLRIGDVSQVFVIPAHALSVIPAHLLSVIPAQAGTQPHAMDSRLRGNDGDLLIPAHAFFVIPAHALSVIPAQAGTQSHAMDSRLRGNDGDLLIPRKRE